MLSETLVLLKERKSEVDGMADVFESDDDATFCAERLAVISLSP